MLQLESGVVTRSRCVGAWGIPSAMEVLSVIIMGRKQAAKTQRFHNPCLCVFSRIWGRLSPSAPGKWEPEWRCHQLCQDYQIQRGCEKRRGAQREKCSAGALGLVHAWAASLPALETCSPGRTLSLFLLSPIPPFKDAPATLVTTARGVGTR